jgi:hypothetical protein
MPCRSPWRPRSPWPYPSSCRRRDDGGELPSQGHSPGATTAKLCGPTAQRSARARPPLHATMRTMSRHLLLASLSVLVGCWRWQPHAYESGQVDRAHGAELVAQIGLRSGALAVHNPHEIEVDVFDYARGCPDLNRRQVDAGYLGTLNLNQGPQRILLPTRTRMVFRVGWLTGNVTGVSTCSGVLTFRPDDGATYRIDYAEEDAEHCRVVAVQLVRDPQAPQEIRAIPIPSLVEVKADIGLGGFVSKPLCGLPR